MLLKRFNQAVIIQTVRLGTGFNSGYKHTLTSYKAFLLFPVRSWFYMNFPLDPEVSMYREKRPPFRDTGVACNYFCRISNCRWNGCICHSPETNMLNLYLFNNCAKRKSPFSNLTMMLFISNDQTHVSFQMQIQPLLFLTSWDIIIIHSFLAFFGSVDGNFSPGFENAEVITTKKKT